MGGVSFSLSFYFVFWLRQGLNCLLTNKNGIRQETGQEIQKKVKYDAQ